MVRMTSKKTTSKKTTSKKTSKKHRDVPDKIFDDYLSAEEDCENDIRKIEEDSDYCREKYLEDIRFCETRPDKDDLEDINSKYKVKIGEINYEINCLEQDNSLTLKSIEKRFAKLISIFVRKYLIDNQIKCKCPQRYSRCQYNFCDDDYYDDDLDVERFINAVIFDDEPKSSSRRGCGGCGGNDFGNYYDDNYYFRNYSYSSDDDEDKYQPALAEIYTADTKIFQCLCFDTILNYLSQYQNFMSEMNKRHIPKITKVIDLSKLCEINIATMMLIPSLKSILSANIDNILQVKKLDTYEHITFNNRFGFDKKIQFTKIDKVLKALKEYKADGNIQNLMCIDATKLKIELDTLRKTYNDKVNECNTKYKNLISSLQKQSKELYQQRIDEIKDYSENLISIIKAYNPNYKEYLALQTEYILYL